VDSLWINLLILRDQCGDNQPKLNIVKFIHRRSENHTGFAQWLFNWQVLVYIGFKWLIHRICLALLLLLFIYTTLHLKTEAKKKTKTKSQNQKPGQKQIVLSVDKSLDK
jgi:hypothetical protein